MGWLETIFRTLLFWLDSIVYKFIPTVYNLLVNIAETSIFSEDVFTLFSNRIYTLLGVFMLFKVSFSILTYIVDPDAFTDKNKGFGKLISNIIMTLVLLILTPFIFTYAMELQGIILKDNIIGKLFSTNGVNTTVVADPGNTMAYETFKAFYYFDVDRYPECDSDNFTGNNADFSCIENISSIEDTASLRKNLEYAHFTGSISVYLDSGIAIMRDSDGNYVMTYTTIFSTITGVVMILLLIVFCFDIAIRSVKLGFLKMLAPVPIISRIDPKKGKDVFDKWVKTCINTYLDLFIRLLAIYFAIFVITQIIDLRFVDAVTGQEMGEVNPFVKVFIILGALLFAKQLPKLIEDLTGMKMDGKFTLNPLKKMSEVPIAGKAANLAIGGADSWIHGNGFMAGVKRNWKNIPLTGGDGKTSIWDTADRKMRREIKEKRDTARQRYEGLDRQRKLEEQLELGSKYSGQAPELIFEGAYLDSYNNVKAAKGKMYAWENYVKKVESDYQAAVTNYGADSIEASTAYESLKKANENYGKAKGQYEYRNSLHNEMKKQMPEYAKIEDAIEAFEKTGGASISGPPELMSQSNQSSTTPKHGPNGKGDPVPGVRNPNTSKKKLKRQKKQ
ncbi:MAG TPA: hypothetical protein IAC20_03900 [Candidatus Faecisoma merdavium]|nr:hypothetical protein [Candidatus Faecisoma merdavium]